MPFLYEYKCNYCDERFEVLKPMSERATHDCPKCGQLAPKMFSLPNVHWGFTLSEASHHEGNPDELVSRKPSNDWLIKA